MYSTVYPITRPTTTGPRRQGRAWRRHLRRHAPAPAAIPPFATRRARDGHATVENTFRKEQEHEYPPIAV